MKNFVFLAVAVVLFVCVAARPEEKYTTKYDGIDLDQILKSDRLFNNYFKCLMDKGKCTPDGSELKRVLPDALLTNCSKCSEKQKKSSTTVIDFVRANKADQWIELTKKYDPENVYVSRLSTKA